MIDWRTLDHASLPGPSRFMASAADALLRDGVLWLGLPASPPSWLLPAFRHTVERKASVRVFDADASKGLGGVPPARWLASLSSLTPTTIRSVADFLADPELADAAFVVHGIRPEDWSTFASFLRMVRAESARTTRLSNPLVVVCPPGRVPPHDVRSATGVGETRWQGRVSRLDTQIATARVLAWTDDHDVASATAAACMVELSGWDLRMIDLLAEMEEERRLAPMAALEAQASRLPEAVPSWENGLVDLWDGHPFEHTLSLLRRGHRNAVALRIWKAQVRILFPFLAHVRAAIVRRFGDLIMRDGVLVKTFHTRTVVYESPERFEFFDILDRLRNRVHPRDETFLRTCHRLRSHLAHLDVAPADFVVALSRFWEENAHRYGDDCVGWDWPRCDQRLDLLVGPSGAGKSTWAARNCDPRDVVSSDGIRAEMFGSIDAAGDQSVIFERVRLEVGRRLATGRPAVIDATNLRSRDRLASISSIPRDMKCRYVVVDRPMTEKVTTAGWRTSRAGLLEEHAELFASEIGAILAGDGLPNVLVEDLRPRET